MANIYLEKIASNAISRRLNGSGRKLNGLDRRPDSPSPNMSVTGNTQTFGAPKGATGGFMSSSTAAKAFGNADRDDVLKTTTIHERLKANQALHGIDPANGNRASQITNANQLRNKGHIQVGGGAASGGGPSAVTRATGQAGNSAMVDAKAGFQSNIHLNQTHVNGVPSVAGTLSSTRPVAKPGMVAGLLARAKTIAGKLPMGKIALGAGAIRAGLAARKALSNRSSSQGNNYEYQQY